VPNVLNPRSVFRWVKAIPASPNTLNRALGEYCAPNTPPPPVLVPVVVTSGSVVGEIGVEVEVDREYTKRGLM
jgi:hypothetical protein